MSFPIRQHTTSPAYRRQLTDGAGEPIMLTGATVTFLMTAPKITTTETIVEAEADVIDGANGFVQYEWSEADTATPDIYDAEWVVEYPDGHSEIFPNDVPDTVLVSGAGGEIGPVEILDEVRLRTGYHRDDITDRDIRDLMVSAQRDMNAITNRSLDYFDTDDMDPNRALMWFTCVGALLRTRELDGPDFRIGSLNVRSIRAAGKENGERAVTWLREAQRFLGFIPRAPNSNRAARFGHAQITRADREYGASEAGDLRDQLEL